jgi:phospholipid/cholesterol/gamma-HCH transport system substrate-binding protein
MTDKRRQLRVGLFTIVALGLVAVVLIAFGGMQFWHHRDHFTVVFDHSVMGLTHGSPVYMNGIEVGEVDGVELDRTDLGRVRVAISVDPGTPVRTDTRAFLSLAVITGLKTIDLSGGSLAAAPVPPGGTIAAGEGTLDKLQKQAEALVDQTSVLMQRAAKVVDGANQVVANLDAMTDPEAIRAIVESTRRTTAQLETASRGITQMVTENRVALRRSLDAVTGAATSASSVIDERVAGLVDNANALVSDVRGIVHSNETVLQGATADLRQASRSFKELAREVRERPSRLLFSGAQPDRRLP